MSSIFSRVMLTGAILIFLSFSVRAAAPEYYVVSDGDYVAVQPAEGEKFYPYHVRLASLPPSDQELLSYGLACKDKVALARAIENFCS